MPKKSWGLPYTGSKNAIAKDIVNALPTGERLVELFAGGCSITDYALKNTNKFTRYLVNDLNGWSPQAYVKALSGGFNAEERWISREDFFRLKETDPYVKLCFSFGNNGNSYMYSLALEPYKRALHHIIFWEDYGPMEDICPQVVDIIKQYCDGKDRKGRRLASGRAVTDHVKQKGSVEYWQSNPLFRAIKIRWTPERRGLKGGVTLKNEIENLASQTMSVSLERLDNRLKSLESLESLERLQSLQSMERLERLERLESLESLESLERLRNLESLESLERLERLQSLKSLQSMESLERLERLQNLQSLQSMESLERLENLTSPATFIEPSNMDYADYKYREGDVVYCDPPYKNTYDYGIQFDSEAFWQWVRTRDYPVYVSEYEAPEDFVSIWSKEKRVLLNRESLTAPRVEHLFIHNRFSK